jgi:hypothetical protein
MPIFEPKHRIVATVGYPGHGKTVFLASLFWDSFFALSETFHDEAEPYSIHALTEEASRVFFDNARMLNRLELPPPNPRTMPEAATLEFRGVPSTDDGWSLGARKTIHLTFYDMAGELVTSDEWLTKNAPFLPDAHDIIFLFDPLRDDFDESVLMAAELRDRIFRVAPTSKRKHFIIALSKLDELRNHDEWWANLLSTRWSASPPSASALPDYLSQMDDLSNSQLVRSWWMKSARQAHVFVKSLPRTTHFCALSALGHQPVWDCSQCRATNPNTLAKCSQCNTARRNASLRLTRKPEPFRVRDPLFWIFRASGIM